MQGTFACLELILQRHITVQELSTAQQVSIVARVFQNQLYVLWVNSPPTQAQFKLKSVTIVKKASIANMELYKQLYAHKVTIVL